MPLAAPDAKILDLLAGRHIAVLATINPDGSPPLTAVWYLYEDGKLHVATFSGSRKARNITARAHASLMVDTRRGGADRGLTAIGRADLLTGDAARAIALRLHRRYLSQAALPDPQVGPVFPAFDDIVIRLTPDRSLWWDTGEVDAAYFGGNLCATPGYLLPLD